MKELLVPAWIGYSLSVAIILIIARITLHWKAVKDLQKSHENVNPKELKKKIESHDCLLEEIKENFHKMELKLTEIHRDVKWLKKNGK